MTQVYACTAARLPTLYVCVWMFILIGWRRLTDWLVVGCFLAAMKFEKRSILCKWAMNLVSCCTLSFQNMKKYWKIIWWWCWWWLPTTHQANFSLFYLLCYHHLWWWSPILSPPSSSFYITFLFVLTDDYLLLLYFVLISLPVFCFLLVCLLVLLAF